MQLTQALGTIEVLGLPAAITAADVACKAADVRLVGYETTDGMGMVSVKIIGQVSAVQAAIAAAKAAASEVTSVFAESVIPRPNDQIGPVVLTPVTVGLGASPAAVPGGGTSPAPATPEEMAAAERAFDATPSDDTQAPPATDSKEASPKETPAKTADASQSKAATTPDGPGAAGTAGTTKDLPAQERPVKGTAGPTRNRRKAPRTGREAGKK